MSQEGGFEKAAGHVWEYHNCLLAEVHHTARSLENTPGARGPR